MTQAYLELMDVVQMTRSRWRLLHGLDGVLVVFTALAGVLVAGAAIDQWVDLSVPGRVAAHGCLWIAAAMTVWRNVFRPVFAAHGDDYYAALIEQRFPFLGNRFINALQLGREPRATGPKLVEAIVNDALTVVDEIDVSRAGSARTLRRHLAFAAALATVLLGYIMLFGPAARTSVARVLLPTADIAPFTWTRLTVSPDQTLHVLEGAPLTIKAQTGGRLPEQAWLRWRTADGRRNAMRMTDTGKGAFVYAFPAVEAGFGFHVTAGDAASPQVQVVVDARPRIETLVPLAKDDRVDPRLGLNGVRRCVLQRVALARMIAENPEAGPPLCRLEHKRLANGLLQFDTRERRSFRRQSLRLFPREDLHGL